ncbi:MAG: hypothetical protein IPM46_10385 [Flavobacteriales bacterium]|nr:hypothetical protein [Flavobacteriales bacterium]
MSRYHLLLAILSAQHCTAQVIGPKQLVTSLGGGVGVLRISRFTPGLSFGSEAAGSATFRFAYAVNGKLSFGAHYDRVGTDRTPEGMDRVRFTAYLLECAYRPWQSERSAVELYAALGPSLMSMRVRDRDLPLEGRSTAAALGARYLRFFGSTLGAFVAVDHAGSVNMTVTDYDGNALEDAEGRPIQLNWSSQRVNAGLVLRF